jgi:hypothetical protein
MIHDAAFTAMEISGEVDTIDEHRADVQGRLARDFFAGDSELLRQLEATALQLKYEGLSVSLFLIFVLTIRLTICFVHRF